ncbi:MAG: dTMP kinase [Anaerolineales bacterium]
MSLFVTLEGPDGCGKTVQSKRLAEHLRSQGLNVVMTREPGGTEIGDQIRQVIMSLENRQMDPRTEFLLFSASRAQLVKEVIRPHLEAGGVIVSDRFYDSSFAYQGYGHGLPLDELRAITAFATGGLVPDLTLLIDLPAKAGLARRKTGGNWNRMDAYDLAFHQRVRTAYRTMAQTESERWRTVDGDQSPDSVQAALQAAVEAFVAQRSP